MKNKNPITEKRAFPRLKSYHLAKYRLVSQPSEQQPIVTSLKDIGGGGVCLFAKEKLPLEGVLQLYINFPHLSSPIPCLAKIVWIKDASEEGTFEVGLQFLDIEEVPRQTIIDHIETVNKHIVEEEMKKSRGGRNK